MVIAQSFINHPGLQFGLFCVLSSGPSSRWKWIAKLCGFPLYRPRRLAAVRGDDQWVYGMADSDRRPPTKSFLSA